MGLEYAEIAVTDMERSLGFYRDLLGFTPVDRADEPGVVWLDAHSGLVKLVEVGPTGHAGGRENDNQQRGIRHFAMKVADVDAHSERLAAAGVEFTITPRTAAGDVRLSFFLDPDGALMELVGSPPKYDPTWSEELAQQEWAEQPHPDDQPRFEHVAVTVADLDASLDFYRDRFGMEVVGQVLLKDDVGFAITFLKAGDAVLEVFSFDAETSPNPWSDDESLLGIRGVGLDGGQSPPELVLDPDGVPLLVGKQA
jgi:catechol 2,3-dioxygenase-like lactoylglutathione lyase family enzyme